MKTQIPHINESSSVQRANSKAIDKMEVKKGRSTTSSKYETNKVVDFVGDVKQELKKVEWTSKEELKAYTKIVVVSTFLFSMFIYLMDLLIQGVLGGVNLLVRAIFG